MMRKKGWGIVVAGLIFLINLPNGLRAEIEKVTISTNSAPIESPSHRAASINPHAEGVFIGLIDAYYAKVDTDRNDNYAVISFEIKLSKDLLTDGNNSPASAPPIPKVALFPSMNSVYDRHTALLSLGLTTNWQTVSYQFKLPSSGRSHGGRYYVEIKLRDYDYPAYVRKVKLVVSPVKNTELGSPDNTKN